MRLIHLAHPEADQLYRIILFNITGVISKWGKYADEIGVKNKLMKAIGKTLIVIR